MSPSDSPDSVSIPHEHRSGDDTPRIVVIGGESTGKTTLARDLARALRTNWVPEYSREYAERLERELTAADVEPIARGQMAAEDEGALEAAGGYTRSSLVKQEVVLDTDLVSTTVYAELYYGHCPTWILEAARARLGDLYLLCLPDLPWEPDGVRDRPLHRVEVLQRFTSRLTEWNATVMTISGGGTQRLEHALAAVRGWRAATTQR
ncbi:MAG: ATP-binding protein [Gemmatimonadaceae bacterium]